MVLFSIHYAMRFLHFFLKKCIFYFLFLAAFTFFTHKGKKKTPPEGGVSDFVG